MRGGDFRAPTSSSETPQPIFTKLEIHTCNYLPGCTPIKCTAEGYIWIGFGHQGMCVITHDCSIVVGYTENEFLEQKKMNKLRRMKVEIGVISTRSVSLCLRLKWLSLKLDSDRTGAPQSTFLWWNVMKQTNDVSRRCVAGGMTTTARLVCENISRDAVCSFDEIFSEYCSENWADIVTRDRHLDSFSESCYME